MNTNGHERTRNWNRGFADYADSWPSKFDVRYWIFNPSVYCLLCSVFFFSFSPCLSPCPTLFLFLEGATGTAGSEIGNVRDESVGRAKMFGGNTLLEEVSWREISKMSPESVPRIGKIARKRGQEHFWAHPESKRQTAHKRRKVECPLFLPLKSCVRSLSWLAWQRRSVIFTVLITSFGKDAESINEFASHSLKILSFFGEK